MEGDRRNKYVCKGCGGEVGFPVKFTFITEECLIIGYSKPSPILSRTRTKFEHNQIYGTIL